MERKRRFELLAYASECFEHCTSPFLLVHLQKKNVLADECKELSLLVGSICDMEVVLATDDVEWYKEILEKARKDFKETQE